MVNIWPDEAQASSKGCESARQLTGRRLAASRTRHYGALTNRWFADRKSRPRIGQGMAAQGKRQEKLWEPKLRDLVTRYKFFSSMSDIGMNSDVDIGTLPISE